MSDNSDPTEDELLAATGKIFKELGLADKIVFAGDGEMHFDVNTGEKTWISGGGCCGGSGCGSKSAKSVLCMMDQIEQRDKN